MQENERKQDIMLAEIQTDIKYIKDFIGHADERYASKTSEKVVYGLVGTILVGVVSALLATIIRAAEFIIENYVR